MLNDRKFLNGLGIGLVVGALLLELMNQSVVTLPPATDSNPPASVSDTALTQPTEPTENNVATERKYTQTEVDSIIQQKLAEAAAASKSAPSPQPGPQKTTDTPSDMTKDETTDITTAVIIQEGLSASEIAELLYRSKIISDREQFLQLLDERNLNRRIQRGYFEFHGHSSVEEIVDQITTALP
ncbi:MAG: hypothetical protein K0R75_3223 [Paenibacillaceae bacterium]|jgi:hypothetical protein|nr:hypothetical protein [Paenibacillaceae bacterium]